MQIKKNRERSWDTFSFSYYRVNYRKEQLDVKISERKLKEEQKAEDELEKERRLEALREQVSLISTLLSLNLSTCYLC